MTSPRRSRSRRRVLLVSTVFAVAASSVACSTHHSRASGHGSQATTRDSSVPEYPRFPLDAYRPTAEQRQALLSAEFHLADGCAAHHGITITLPLPPARSDFVLLYATDLRPVTRPDAHTLGYHLPPSGTSPSDEAIAKLSPDKAEIMIGWNSASGLPKPASTFLLTGGCVGQAVRQLTANDDSSVADEQYVDQLINDSVGQAQAAPDLAGPMHQWSNCMANSGYGALHTTRDAIVKAQPGAGITADEVKQAVQDVNCKDSSRLIDTWTALITKYQQAAIQAHEGKLTPIKARLSQRLQRAESVGN